MLREAAAAFCLGVISDWQALLRRPWHLPATSMAFGMTKR
jgi:hypothetical protein